MTGNEEFTGPIINRDFVTGRPSSSSSSRILRRGMHHYGDKSSIFFPPRILPFERIVVFFFFDQLSYELFRILYLQKMTFPNLSSPISIFKIPPDPENFSLTHNHTRNQFNFELPFIRESKRKRFFAYNSIVYYANIKFSKLARLISQMELEIFERFSSDFVTNYLLQEWPAVWVKLEWARTTGLQRLTVRCQRPAWPRPRPRLHSNPRRRCRLAWRHLLR